MAEKAQHIGRAFDDVGAGPINALHPRVAQILIVLRRDDAARDHLDVAAPGLLQFADQFGDQGLVPGGEARRADDIDAAFEREHDSLAGCLE